MPSNISRKARPGSANGSIINDLSANVKALRNMRPLANVWQIQDLPWGQSISPGPEILLIGFTTDAGITKGTLDEGTGDIILGTGLVYPAYYKFDTEDPNNVRLSYIVQGGVEGLTPNTPEVRVFNMAYNEDGAVDGMRWTISARIMNLWIVIYEECPESSGSGAGT